MAQGARWRYRPVVLGCIAWSSCCAAPALAVDINATAAPVPLLEASRDLLRAERPFSGRDLGAAAMMSPTARRPEPVRAEVDVSPAIDEIFGFFHRHGLPLQPQKDENGSGPIGVYAHFSVGRDVPAVSFHLGDRPLEPLGAFYSNERGFRCAVVWPVKGVTLRLEGGEDSEFGYYGIAGVQWMHPRRPLAIGIGLPMNLQNAEGDVGLIFQFRMNLD
jgi:hypothetical protein